MQEQCLGGEKIQQFWRALKLKDLLLSQFTLSTTHILQNSSSCIDLIFVNQSKFVTDSGVHPFLCGNCHHQIRYLKLNLKTEYPPAYERLVWDYKHSMQQAINKVIEGFNWGNHFETKLLMHRHVSLTKLLSIFAATILQINMQHSMRKIHLG